jgi:prolyl-tRNA editing enzyme YbaK/EbsC (Cys-tRNA(Pro) deacylase)
MEPILSASSQKVQNALREYHVFSEVIELPASTRTAQEAAEAVGCEIGQIVKSLIFMEKETSLPILVLASGSNRVNEKVIGSLVGGSIKMAKADFVRDHTGFVIGGVPPIAHRVKISTLIDADLLNYPFLWAAAGTPHSVFQVKPDDLIRITEGRIVKIY